MTIIEAINKRVSRRKYIDSRIDGRKILPLHDLIQSINDETGLSITYSENGAKAFDGFSKSYGLFSGVRYLIIMKGPISDPDLLEKCGYYGEKLVLEATRLDLGTCWVGGSFDRSARIIDINANEQVVCVITLGQVPSNKGLGEKLIHSVVHRKSKPLAALYKADIHPPSWFMSGMEAVQKAPSARNNQPVLFTYEMGKVTASVTEANPFDLVDLGIAKLHFELLADGRFERGNGGRFKQN